MISPDLLDVVAPDLLEPVRLGEQTGCLGHLSVARVLLPLDATLSSENRLSHGYS